MKEITLILIIKSDKKHKSCLTFVLLREIIFKGNNNMKIEVGKHKKRDITVYIILRALVILTMISQILRGNFENVFMCILTLALFTLPVVIEHRFNIKLPNLLESIILLFIFSAEILRRGTKFLWNI